VTRRWGKGGGRGGRKRGLLCKRVRTDDAMQNIAGKVSPANTANRTSGQLIERRLHRVRSSAAERRGAGFAIRSGLRACCCGQAGTDVAGRAPPAGWPALWRACGVAPGGGLEQQRMTKARSRERSSARGVGRAGRSWRRGSVRAGVALACGLLCKPHDGAVGGGRRPLQRPASRGSGPADGRKHLRHAAGFTRLRHNYATGNNTRIMYRGYCRYSFLNRQTRKKLHTVLNLPLW